MNDNSNLFIFLKKHVTYEIVFQIIVTVVLSMRIMCIFCWQGCSGDEQAHAYKYLANYHFKANQLEKASYAAQKCTEFFEVPVLLFRFNTWILYRLAC